MGQPFHETLDLTFASGVYSDGSERYGRADGGNRGGCLRLLERR